MKKQLAPEKERIMNMTAALFGERGYAATSIRDIAQELNMSLAKMYYYYKNKEDLLYSIIEAIGNDLLEVLNKSLKDNSDPLMRLDQMLFHHICSIPAKRNHVKVFVEELVNLSKRHRNIIYKQHRKIYEAYLEQLAELEKRKMIRFGELPVAAFALIGMANWTYRWYRDSEVPIEDVARITTDLFLGGALSNAGQARYKELTTAKTGPNN